MQCPGCQHENPPQAKFCLECGARFAAACAQCGTQLPVGARFCLECGKPIDGHGTEPARFASPQSYTPRHLAEKILTSKSALEGERKQVTVLFADVKGSMELLAGRDPEDSRKLLDPVLERMMEAVHRYEGTVNQVMGDGIMALFGAPLAHEDHAVRACYAALRMQESMKAHSADVERAAGVPIQLRVGLNSGEVVVRSIGSDLRMDYTAVGQTTHLAARLEQLATPGSILIASATLGLVEGHVVVTPRGSRVVKGLAVPIQTYELVGASTIRSRFQAAAARGLSRFVGRAGELGQLGQALDRARAGHGQVVAVVGEPGVGKSRLYWEFTHSDPTQDSTILESGSVSYGRATSYLPIIELLKGYFRIVSADPTDAIREKVTGTLLALDRQLEPCLSPILWLLDVPITDAKWERLDPPQRRQRVLDGVTRLLLHESQVRPLLVVFEDLHWIDAETQSLLDGLVESLPTARVLLLVNYRPEYSHGWGSKTHYSQLRIDPLAAASADELLDALLGRDPSVAPLKRLLIERTEGNPFFLEESVRSLLETGVLAGERDAYRLVKAPDNLQIPATAQAILAARIDRLAHDDKRLLQSASVIGKDVPFALLRAVADDAEDAVRVGVARLVAGQFLYEARRFPDLEYAFEHALTHEVAYGSVLQDRRRALHARLVGAMEDVYADRLSEQIERLAHHALRGEVWDKAVTYQRQAGTRAVARSAYREAVAGFEQALDGLTRLPMTPEALEQDIELRFDLRTALLAVGEMAKSLDHLREAERRARMLDDQRRLGWVSAYLAFHFWMTGRPADASTFGRSALAIAEARGDHTLRVAANTYLGYACLAAGDYAGAIDLLRRSVRWLEGDLSRERFGNVPFPAAAVPSFLAVARAERGEFAEGVTEGQAAIRVAEALEHPYSLTLVWSNVATLYSIKGDLGQATRLLERALALSREALLPAMSLYAMAGLTHVYALSGRADEAVTMGLETLTGAATMGLQTHSALALVRLGDACLLAGRPDPALAFAGQALTLARDLGQRGGEAWALRLLGEIAAGSDPPDVESAEGHLGEALALAEQLGMRPLVAHCHLGLGRLASRSGKRSLARQHLARAAAMYREMDMGFWLEKAEAALEPPHGNSP